MDIFFSSAEQTCFLMISKKRKEPERTNVFFFNAYLCYGTLAHGVLSEKRRIEAARLTYDEWYGSRPITFRSRDFMRRRKQQIVRLSRTDRDVYVWYDRNADGILHFWYICSLLRGTGARIFPVTVPDDGGCDSFAIREFDEMLYLRREAAPADEETVARYAAAWDDIVSAGGVFRYLDGGAIRSGDIDVLDGRIRDSIPDGEFRIIDVISDAIRYHDLFGADFDHVMRRICHIVREGDFVRTKKQDTTRNNGVDMWEYRDVYFRRRSDDDD